MKCKILRDYSNVELIEANLLPDTYKDLRKPFIFGIKAETAEIEEDREKKLENLLGIAVFVADSSRYSVMNLLHICVLDKDKEGEYAKELIKYAIDQFKDISVKAIEFKQALSKEDADRYNLILPYLGFERESDYSQVMICPQGSFQGKNMDKIYGLASKSENEIVMIEDYYNPSLRDFMYENADTKFYISYSEYDARYCRFCIKDNEIKAAVMARILEDGDILIDGCYVDKKINQPHIIPYMISVIGYDNKNDIDTSKHIHINMYNAGMAEALLKFMGDESAMKVELKDLLYYKLMF